MTNNDPHLGIIMGPMFSEKTTDLIGIMRRYEEIRYQAQLFKPAKDDRYSKDKAATHSKMEWPSTLVGEVTEKSRGKPVESKEIIEKLSNGVKVVGIEEGQFFTPDLADVCRKLVNEREMIVYVAGLNADINEMAFPTMQALMPYANNIIFKHALCKGELEPDVYCGKPASKTIFLGDSKMFSGDGPAIKVGAKDFSARCQIHYNRDRT
jgi:thymidine kinase